MISRFRRHSAHEWAAVFAASFLALSLAACARRDGGSNAAARGASAAADSASPSAGSPSASTIVLSAPSFERPSFLSDENLANVPEPKLTPGEFAAIAPATLRLRDLGFLIPQAAPDTTGLKNKLKLRREWVEALQDYEAGRIEPARVHLQRAREFLANAQEPDANWPFRIRNLDAACVYALAAPDGVRLAFGEIADPRADDVLDVAYEWVLAHEDLRAGRGRDAVARLRFIQASPLKVALEARKVLYKLIPDAALRSFPDSSSAESK